MDDVVRRLSFSPGEVERATRREFEDLRRREREYRGDRPPLDVRGRIVIVTVVGGGLATGTTIRAAARALREHGPARVVAVPVAAGEPCDEFRRDVDEIVCSRTPESFRAVGYWYDDFSQTTDEEVRELLARSASHREASDRPGAAWLA